MDRSQKEEKQSQKSEDDDDDDEGDRKDSKGKRIPLTEEEKTEMIQNYHLNQQSIKKSELCRFWLRGICIFQQKDCHFAHGFYDFNYIENSDPFIDGTINKDLDQRKIWAFRNYNVVYEYQQDLLTNNQFETVINQKYPQLPLNTIISQEDINQDLPRYIRRTIRDRMIKNHLRLFIQFLINQNPETYQTSSYLEREICKIGFSKVGFRFNIDYILKTFAQEYFEAKITLPPRLERERQQKKSTQQKKNGINQSQPSQNSTLVEETQADIAPQKREPWKIGVLLKFKPVEETKQLLLELMRKIIIDLGFIKDSQTGDFSFPILEKDLQQEIYNRTSDFQPPLWQTEIRLKMSFKEIVDEAIFGNGFPQEFQKIFNMDIKSEKIVNYQDEVEKLMVFARNDLIKARKGFFVFNLDQLQYKIRQKFRMQSKSLGTMSKFKNFVRTDLLKFNCLVIKHIENDFLLVKDHQNLTKQDKKHSCNCQFQPISIKKAQTQVHEKYGTDASLPRLTYVNSQETFKIAEFFIRQQDLFGVDIEGVLKRDHGYIELIQISFKASNGQSKIFIFDMYYFSNIEELKPFYEKEVAPFMSSFMLNEEQKKIFHDCRSDSLALHVYLKACPQNVFDTAAVYVLLDKMTKYIGITFDQMEDNDICQFLNKMDHLELPGLNKVLENFQAPHGINELQEKFKDLFGQKPPEFFLQRPISLIDGYLEYSARDVEDLVDVYNEMISQIEVTGKQVLGNHFNKVFAGILCDKISKQHVESCRSEEEPQLEKESEIEKQKIINK